MAVKLSSLLFLFALATISSIAAQESQQATSECKCAAGCYGSGEGDCCHEQCDGGCTNPTNTGCAACRGVKLNGRCQEGCGSPFIYNETSFELGPNPDFYFQHGQECVKLCPKFVFTEGTRCVEQCSLGFRGEGDQCVGCGDACPQEEANPLVNDQCDGFKPYPWGVISRKNSPTAGVTCSQVLIGPRGSTLKLQLSDVKIHKTIGESLVLSGNRYRQSFDRDAHAAALHLDTNALVVQHRTYATGHGFNLKYNFIPSPATTNSVCDQVFTNHSGSFQSPGYPSKYRARERCTYQIIVEPGHRIDVVFKRFYLQGSEPDCLNDRMEVREPLLGTTNVYCGRHKPPFTIASRSNYLFLTFTSSDLNNYKGYDAEIVAVELPASDRYLAEVDDEGDLPPTF